jgi:hypothetical protein
MQPHRASGERPRRGSSSGYASAPLSSTSAASLPSTRRKSELGAGSRERSSSLGARKDKALRARRNILARGQRDALPSLVSSRRSIHSICSASSSQARATSWNALLTCGFFACVARFFASAALGTCPNAAVHESGSQNAAGSILRQARQCSWRTKPTSPILLSRVRYYTFFWETTAPAELRG